MAKEKQGAAAAIRTIVKKIESDVLRFDNECRSAVASSKLDPVEAYSVVRRAGESLEQAFRTSANISAEVLRELIGGHEQAMDSYPQSAPNPAAAVIDLQGFPITRPDLMTIGTSISKLYAIAKDSSPIGHTALESAFAALLPVGPLPSPRVWVRMVVNQLDQLHA